MFLRWLHPFILAGLVELGPALFPPTVDAEPLGEKTINHLVVLSTFEGETSSIPVLEKAYAKLGLQIKVVVYPGERAWREAELGNVDGFLVGFKQPSNSRLIRVLVPIKHSDKILYVRKDRLTELGPRFDKVMANCKFSETELTISVLRGLDPSPFDTRFRGRYIFENDWKTCFRSLDEERTDAVLATADIYREVIGKTGFPSERFVPLPRPLAVEDVYHYLNARHKDWVPRLEKALKEILFDQER